MSDEVSHKHIIDRVNELGESCGILGERVAKVEERQELHWEVAKEVRDDVKQIKANTTRMLGFGAGIAATVTVIWAAIVATWEFLRGNS